MQIDEKALEAAIEATRRAGQRGDLTSSPVSRVVMEAAILTYESAKQKGESEGWRGAPVAWAEEYGGRIVSVALEQGSFHKTPLYRAMLSAGGER